VALAHERRPFEPAAGERACLLGAGTEVVERVQAAIDAGDGDSPLEVTQVVGKDAGEMLAGRGLQRAVGPPRRVGRKRRRSLQERRRRGEPTPGTRADGRPLKLTRHVLIWPRDRMRAMPGSAIGVKHGIGGPSQRPMYRPPLLRRSRAIDGRTQKRMAKRHLRA
jgi:hypothetical protein